MNKNEPVERHHTLIPAVENASIVFGDAESCSKDAIMIEGNTTSIEGYPIEGGSVAKSHGGARISKRKQKNKKTAYRKKQYASKVERTPPGGKINKKKNTVTPITSDSAISSRMEDPAASQTSPSRSKLQIPESESALYEDFVLQYIPTRNSSLTSQGTEVPSPPPLRSSATRTVPGATRVLGIRAPSPSSAEESAQAPNAQVVPTPLLNASLVVDDEGSCAVFAEPLNAPDMRASASSFRPSLKDRRCMIFIGVLIFAIVCFASGIVLFLGSQENPSQNDQLEGNRIVPSTQIPTLQPTNHLEFDPPSQDECMAIAEGRALLGEEEIVVKNFLVDMDVVLDPFRSMAPFLDILREQMQAILAPALVGCDDIFHRRLRRKVRQRQRDYVVANAVFEVALPNGRQCKADTPENCYRVVSNIDLFLQDDEKIVKLIGMIMEVFDEESLVQRLDLSTPFVSIEMVGVTSKNPTLSPTVAPTSPPSRQTFPTVEYEDEDNSVDGED